MTDKDRIRLVEAMGHTINKEQGCINGDGPARGQFIFRGPAYQVADIKIWNPLTDANDDVAILNLALTMKPDWAMEFFDETKYDHIAEYRVGHFARTLLKVIDND